VGRLEAFSVPGCECWFHTGDHGPHHFHVGVADEWEVRVFFMLEPVKYEVKFQVKKIPSRTLRRVLEQAAAHRAGLLEEWDGHASDD
jgi:hypothetical protein